MSDYTPTTEEVRDYIRAADRVTAHMFAAGADSIEAFDRWLAAHDAEVRAGFVAEEPEWEYGVRLHPRGRVDSGTNTALYVPPTTPHITMERAVEMAQLNPRYRATFHRRRKAGPWVPVKHDD